MKRSSRKRRHLMLAGLLLSGAVWAIDALSGDGAPAPAAATAGAPTGPEDDAGRAAAEVQALLRAAETVEPRAPELSLGIDERDLFEIPSAILEVLAPERARALQAPAPQPVEEVRLRFQSQHQLQGVITGPARLAVVDGKLLRVGARLDGHVLRSIHRDHVVFEGPGSRVVLHLQRGRPAASQRSATAPQDKPPAP